LAFIVNTTAVTHVNNPLYMGCHSDSGYTHQPRGFYSQMVFDESFESGLWQNVEVSAGTAGTAVIDTVNSFHGHASAAVQLSVAGSSAPFVGVGNRGLGNEGLVFQANQPYDGYFFAAAAVGTQLTLEVRLDEVDSSGNVTTLGRVQMQFTGQGMETWVQVRQGG
jgi:hypothetical protein